ncbi:M3 family metallopeptidase [Amycolatopsis nigrescens]|uniref:M3 family metallopeptidase n=1 Tax=Amycolatopsis nigrescens TaxID=381445 RepID=UPI0003800887|nr:M3 family metallopeptidase [Amycolatopsis nigrescens]
MAETAALPRWHSTFIGIRESDLDGALGMVSGRLDEFSGKYLGKVAGMAADELAEALRDYESLLTPLQQATTYAEAKLAVDAEDPVSLALLDRCEALWDSVVERAEFFEREIGELPDSGAADLLRSPALAEYANHLRKVRAAAGLQPPAPVAGVFAQLDPIGGWERQARRLLDRIVVTDGGERLSLGNALPTLYQPDLRRRRRICAAISAALEPEVELRAAALAELTRARIARHRACGVAGWLHEEQLSNQVSHGEVTALLDVVHAQHDIVHHYYQAKSALFGGQLTDADRYAPVSASAPRLDWPEACAMVLNSFASLGKTVAAVAAELLDRGAVDALPRRGKRHGAFTFSMPGGHSCVLVNFTGSPRDVLTLAHELGHAVHGRLSGRQGMLNFAAPTVLAETVALFAEAVVMETYGPQLDAAGRQSLLARRLEDQLVAIFRQVALHDFEASVHELVGAGELPGEAAFGDIWIRGQAALYGPAVSLGAGYRHWWSYVDSFFFTPGTRYAYAFGQLAATALLVRHRGDPAGFATRFERLLRAGGSGPPAALLADVGLRTADPGGWQAGMSAIRRQVEEFADRAAVRSSG